jgi:hypothetical protein
MLQLINVKKFGFNFVVKMAPHIKLIYVDAKALAEPIRFLFAYGKIQYDDIRMTHEDFKSDKSSKLLEGMEKLIILMYV